MLPDTHQLDKYLAAHAGPEPELLQRIYRTTQAKVLMPNMVSGHLQGRLLSMLSKMQQPRNILELGTFTGYATLCLAEGLQPGGTIYTIDKNEELEDMVRGFFAQSEYNNQINYTIGHIARVLPQLAAISFDLVFIDADKANNLSYYKSILPQVRPGGLIIADNVLWHGKVLDNAGDERTRHITQFNRYVAEDSSVEKVILPLRDGLFLIRKL